MKWSSCAAAYHQHQVKLVHVPILMNTLFVTSFIIILFVHLYWRIVWYSTLLFDISTLDGQYNILVGISCLQMKRDNFTCTST